MMSDNNPANRTATPANTTIAAMMLMSWVVDSLHEPLTHAVPAEDLLGEHRAGEQPGDAVGEHRGHRDQRRAQPMFEQRLASGQPFGASGADEVLAEHVEHRVALIPAVTGHGPERQRERRQHQML